MTYQKTHVSTNFYILVCSFKYTVFQVYYFLYCRAVCILSLALKLFIFVILLKCRSYVIAASAAKSSCRSVIGSPLTCMLDAV